MDKKAMSLPLVGASIWGGLSSLKDFDYLRLGNIVLTFLPESEEEGMELMRYCREHKIYVLLSEIIHRGNHSRWRNKNLSKEQIERIAAEGGEYFLGRYAIGECGGLCYWPKEYTINAQAENYTNLPPCENEQQARKTYVDYLKKELQYEREHVADLPLFNVESSIQFSYHTEAGIDGQCLELLPGDPLITLSAIRGAARVKDMLWGVHIAMAWYGGFRLDPLWLKRWRASLYVSYLAGAEFIFPESGHLTYHFPDAKSYEFSSAEMRLVRRELRELYAFSKIHSRGTAGPETPCAIVLGQDDGHPGIWNPYAWGQYEKGPEWESSDAERGWALYDVLFKREDFFHANVNGDFDYSGNPPCGQLDITCPDGDFSRYKLLIFTGYNRMDDVLYEKLIRYVEQGGHLLLYLSHFDTAERRGDPVKLYRNGDLSALCGFRAGNVVKEEVRGIKYMAKSSFKQYEFPDKSIQCDPCFLAHIREVEITLTSPETRVIAGLTHKVSDRLEELASSPLVVEHTLGKGVVFTVSTPTKPGEPSLRAFGENLIRSAVRAHRGDFELVTSDTVRYAVYRKDSGRTIYVFNQDGDLYGDVRIVSGGKILEEHILLAPNEFKVLYLTDDGVLLIPEKVQTDLEQTGEKVYTLTGEKQRVRLLSLSGKTQTLCLNQQQVVLEGNSGKVLDCAEYIPEEKAQYFTEAFLEEDRSFVMQNPSTPY